MLDILRHKPSRGNLILAVSGGMYAEGVDYRGDMLSGVMVVGPALPTVSFEQELLKRYYDEQYGSGFEFAYLIPGMTRVVQSAGRVIRSETDIGIIALSLALSPQLQKEGKYWLIPEASHQPLKQGYVLLLHAKGNEGAQKFTTFVESPKARAILEYFGFGNKE